MTTAGFYGGRAPRGIIPTGFLKVSILPDRIWDIRAMKTVVTNRAMLRIAQAILQKWIPDTSATDPHGGIMVWHLLSPTERPRHLYGSIPNGY